MFTVTHRPSHDLAGHDWLLIEKPDGETYLVVRDADEVPIPAPVVIAAFMAWQAPKRYADFG